MNTNHAAHSYAVLSSLFLPVPLIYKCISQLPNLEISHFLFVPYYVGPRQVNLVQKVSKMRNYLSGRESRAINGKKGESKVGMVPLFYTGDRTK